MIDKTQLFACFALGIWAGLSDFFFRLIVVVALMGIFYMLDTKFYRESKEK